jgi:membrane protein DedA with SNARE-associated domain
MVLAGSATAMATLGTALSPYLLVHHPAWLVAMNPDIRHIVLSATSLDLETMLLIGVPRRILGMCTSWGLGTAYGGAALGFIESRYPRVLRIVRLAQRVFVRTGLLLLVVWPIFSLAMMAGVVRTPFVRFLIATSFGQLFYVLVSYYFGREISGLTDAFLVWLSAHIVETTVVCVVGVAVQLLVHVWRNARRRAKTESAPEAG